MLIRFIWNLIKFPLLPFWLLIRAMVKPKSKWIFFKIHPQVLQFRKSRPWLVRFLSRGTEQKVTSLEELRMLEKHLQSDSKMKGVVFSLRPLQVNWATLTSLRMLVEKISKQYPTVMYLPYGGGQKEIYLASAAKEIIVHPHATLSLLGVSLESQYFKKLLDKIGVQVEVISCGKYKTALESVSRAEISEGQKEQLEALSTGLHQIVTKAFRLGREVSETDVEQWFEKALFHGNESVEKQISDLTLYPDELEKRFALEKKNQKEKSQDDSSHDKNASSGVETLRNKESAEIEKVDSSSLDKPNDISSNQQKKKNRSPKLNLINWKQYLGYREASFFSPILKTPYIAIVDAQGAIIDAEHSGGKRICAPKMIEALTELREDPKVLAVILAINSPGGSAIASDLMHREIVRLKTEKPVIACMGDVAASGGYYMAAGADHIICEPSTITGSIGVISAKLTASGLQEKVGIGSHTIKSAEHADMYSPSRKLSSEEHDLILEEMRLFYQRFLQVVAEGRKKTPADIDSLAQGRVWLGKDALDVGLVDQLGGISEAITFAREKLSLPDSVKRNIRAEWVTTDDNPFPMIPFSQRASMQQMSRFILQDMLGFSNPLESGFASSLELLQLIETHERVFYYDPNLVF